jgi:hypothetical protein
MIDSSSITNQVQTALDTGTAIHAQLQPYLPALAVALGWLGRELSNLRRSFVASVEFVISQGGIGWIVCKLLWNPPAKGGAQ